MKLLRRRVAVVDPAADFLRRVDDLRDQLMTASGSDLGDAADALLTIAERHSDGTPDPDGDSQHDAGAREAIAQALGALVRRANQLTANRTRLAAVLFRWTDAIDILTTSANADDRRTVADLAALGQLPTAIVRCADLSEDSDEGVADAAARALTDLAARIRDLPESVQDAVIDAVSISAARIDAHRRREIVAAFLDMLTTPALTAGPCLAAAMADDSLPLHSELRTLLRRTSGPDGASRAVICLKYATLAAACASRLAASTSPDEQAAAAREWWRLAHPARTEGLSDRNTIAMCALLDDGAPGATADVRLNIARLRRRLSGENHPAGAMPSLADDAPPAVRLAVAVRSARESVTRLELCFDADHRVARSAAIQSLPDLRPGGRAWGLSPAWADRSIDAMTRSPHPFIRALARQALDRRGNDPASPMSRLPLRRQLRHDRDGAAATLQAQFDSAPIATRITMLCALRHTGLVSLLGNRVPHSAVPSDRSSADPRLIATAAAALGDLDDPDAERAIESCLHDPDDRVRANAAEALTRRFRRGNTPARWGSERLAQLLHDPHHRVRAAAVLGVARLADDEAPTAAAALASMLADDRPLHRIGALWAVGRLAQPSFWRRWGELASRLAAIAASDAEPVVRARAAQSARTIATVIRAGWSTACFNRSAATPRR